MKETKTIQKFTEELILKISETLGERYKITSNVVKKINTELLGLQIFDNEQTGTNMVPSIYVNSFYHQYLNSDISMDEISDEVISTYMSNKTDKSFDVSYFTDWQAVKKLLTARIINSEMNRELIQEIPHIEFLDLTIVFYVTVDLGQQGIGSVLVRNEHMKYWDVDVEDLSKAAFEENRIFDQAVIQSMESILRGMIEDELMSDQIKVSEADISGMIDGIITQNSMMYVLTNKDKQFGAIELMDVNTLEMIASKLESDLAIIPSSVHELILLKLEDRSSADMLAGMICDVNQTLNVSDKLSDHPYFYEWGSRKVEIM